MRPNTFVYKFIYFVFGSLLCFRVNVGMATPANLKTRTALVIGNAHYEAAVGPLQNTHNDAKSMAKTLRELGFTVIERYDLSRDQLLKAVDQFRTTLPGAEVALFYYAGHGISIAGANYLIPLKSGFTAEGADNVTLRMRSETRLFNAEQAIADMGAAGAGCNLVILDACRNTPINKSTKTRDATNHGGLSEMTPPAGSLIAFATDAGQTASDGEGANGLYTDELMKHLRTRGLTIEQVFKRTRAGVLKRSGGIQVPSEYSRLVGDDVYLAGPAIALPAKIAVPAASKPALVAVAVTIPSVAQLSKLAEARQVEDCTKGLQVLVRSRGPGAYAAQPLDALLTGVKEDLKQIPLPSDKLSTALATCDLVLRLLPECVPSGAAGSAALAAKAHNRRGDALLLSDRAEEAVPEFDAAAFLDPSDPYILYNRGRANLTLDRKPEAKADFTAASAARFGRSNARKLAARALAEMK